MEVSGRDIELASIVTETRGYRDEDLEKFQSYDWGVELSFVVVDTEYLYKASGDWRLDAPCA